jgi:DNA-binding winged helix-turn-helix (wHTH) protein/TolB-like protein
VPYRGWGYDRYRELAIIIKCAVPVPIMERRRFGIFDFDLQTGELRREGRVVRLQAQPAQVLGVLLSHAGTPVTRDTLREVVWGSDTFVDFDRGLNFCVAQIRSALGDSAESPRYIKTLPKRGYQFIAPVHSVTAAVSTPNAEVQPKSRRWMLAAPISIGVAALGGLLVWKRPWANVGLPRIAVARFENQTGNPELDRFAEGLTDTLVVEMTGVGAGRYSVIGNASILLQPRSFRDVKMIGETLKARYVVLGQVQRNAESIRVLAHLIRLPEQTHLTAARLECDPSDSLKAQAELAKQIAANFHRKLDASPAGETS